MIKSYDFKIGLVPLWLLALALIPSVLWAGEAPAATGSASKPSFVLRGDGELLSLTATNASLKGILHAIGRQLKIPVATKIPDQAVTISFNRLSVVEALKDLHVNAIYFQRTEGDQKRITKIIVLRQGQAERPKAEVKRQKPRPEPFKFEFDPMQAKRKAQAN